jgi:hypothetical protein
VAASALKSPHAIVSRTTPHTCRLAGGDNYATAHIQVLAVSAVGLRREWPRSSDGKRESEAEAGTSHG